MLQLRAHLVSFEVLDSVPIPMRNLKRWERGWLAWQTRLRWSMRLGYYVGFHGLIAVNPCGIITGFAFGGANEKD